MGRGVRHFCCLTWGPAHAHFRGCSGCEQSCRHNWSMWFLEPPDSPFLSQASCCQSQHFRIWGCNSIPALLGRCLFPPGTFLPYATAKPGAGLGPCSLGTTASFSQAARLGGSLALQLPAEWLSLSSCLTLGLQINKQTPQNQASATHPLLTT